MLLVSGYNILEKIGFCGNKLLYRAERREDSEKVILKILENSNSRIEETGMTNEYEIARNLSAKGIINYINLEAYENRNVAILKNFEGISLQEYVENNEINIEHIIKIAISITEILQIFYQEGLIHQDLSPACFFVNPNTLEVKLIDFSSASPVNDLNKSDEPSNLLIGSLTYISPEQTGRIKGEIDIRSDLYSFGIILYELATGKVPFRSKEALALIHCHIAKSPVPPEIINPELPGSLSKIILKLIAKNSRDRYQSPSGLKSDLRKCLSHWVTNENTTQFELGQFDYSGKLQNPKKFHGREKEITILQQAFNRVGQGAVEIVLVEGPSGIGKSALVQQLKDSILLERKIFLGGKFNQFQRNIPYSAFIQVFKEFTDYILAHSTEIIAIWRDRILQAVGSNGKLLIDIVPHLELIIGQQPAVPNLEPNETQNRLHYVFANFIKCISQKEHQLTIFFDDIQWADPASLNLLKIIATTQGLQSFLFIGAYRDNEMTANSMFYNLVDDMIKEGCHVQKIILSPLTYDHVEELVSDILDRSIQDSKTLTDFIYKKSHGNPFFIRALVKCLYSEKGLVFDFSTFAWKWDDVKVNELKFTDDIVELMIGRIQILPESAQNILKLAACIGYTVDLILLEVLLPGNQMEIAEKLKPAIDEGLVFLSGDKYRFAHDRVQQAAYSLINDSEKEVERLKIGNSLLRNLNDEARNSYIFEIVNQLNAGSRLIISHSERQQLAELNLRVALKAKNSAAYRPSFEYLLNGIHLLDRKSWNYTYDLTLQLYTTGAESAFLSGNIKEMDEWIEIVLQNAKTVLDKVKVYEIRIKSNTAQHKLVDAVKTSLEILQLLNISFPKNPKRVHVLFALLKTKIALSGIPLEHLVDLPLMKDAYVEAATRLLASVGAPVFFAMPNLFPLFVCKAFALMVKHGSSPYSGVVCAGYGLIVIAGVGDINKGYRLGKVAVQLSEKFEVSSFRYQCTMMVNNFIIHWREHLKFILEPLRTNYGHCLETGNTEFASYSAGLYCCNSFFCGKNLRELTKEMLHFNEAIKQLRQETALNIQKILTQAVLNLVEPNENPDLLTGNVHSESEMVPLYYETKAESLLFYVYLYKLILSYIFEKHDRALLNAGEARSRLQSAPGSSRITIFYFYETLAMLAVYPRRFGFSRIRLYHKISRNIRLFRKFERLAPMNCSHKLKLIEAELCRVTGRFKKAADFYDKAIAEAKKQEYLNDLALSYELAGKYYQGQKKEFVAQHYLLHAYNCYKQWGAFAKVKDMEEKYSDTFNVQEPQIALDNNSLNKSQASVPELMVEQSSQELDLNSILKAATAISSEVQLDRLLKKLVKIAVENVGAQHGYLILKNDTEFSIEAEGSINTEQEVIVHSVPLKGNESVSEVIVQFVYLTKENLVIDNALEHPNFSTDPIIEKRNSKSILVVPIKHQGDVIGILYFENNLITDAFTQDRVELLRLLSGQMAISLQNALNEQKKMNDLLEREKLLKKINLHQQELLKTKLEIQEQTFHNISGELHDNIGQVLSFIKLNINTIDVKFPDLAKEKLTESKNLLTKVIQDIRDLAKTLNTDFIEKIGLTNAIDQQIQFLTKTGLYSAHLTVNGEVSKYDSQRELVIFRMVQELLNNIVKHAEATTIHISMEYQINKLLITVEDNGKGFDVEKQLSPDNQALGLRNMHNRISLINGNILFESELQKGTTATIELYR